MMSGSDCIIKNWGINFTAPEYIVDDYVTRILIFIENDWWIFVCFLFSPHFIRLHCLDVVILLPLFSTFHSLHLILSFWIHLEIWSISFDFIDFWLIFYRPFLPFFRHDFDLPLSLLIIISWTCTASIN